MGKYRVFSKFFLFASLIVLIPLGFSGCGGDATDASGSGQVRTFPLTLVGQLIGGAGGPAVASAFEAESCQVQLDVVLSADGTPFQTFSMTQRVACQNGVPLQGELITILQDEVITGPLGGQDSDQLGIFATVSDPFAGVTGGAFSEFTASALVDIKVFLGGTPQNLILKNQTDGAETNTVLLPFSQGGVAGLGLSTCDLDCFCRNADAVAVLGSALLCPYDIPDDEALAACEAGEVFDEDGDLIDGLECDPHEISEANQCRGFLGLTGGISYCDEDRCQCDFVFCPILNLLPEISAVFEEATGRTLEGDLLRVSTVALGDQGCPITGNGIVEPEIGEECDAGDYIALLDGFGIDLGIPIPPKEGLCPEGFFCGSFETLDGLEDGAQLGKCIPEDGGGGGGLDFCDELDYCTGAVGDCLEFRGIELCASNSCGVFGNGPPVDCLGQEGVCAAIASEVGAENPRCLLSGKGGPACCVDQEPVGGCCPGGPVICGVGEVCNESCECVPKGGDGDTNFCDEITCSNQDIESDPGFCICRNFSCDEITFGSGTSFRCDGAESESCAALAPSRGVTSFECQAANEFVSCCVDLGGGVEEVCPGGNEICTFDSDCAQGESCLVDKSTGDCLCIPVIIIIP